LVRGEEHATDGGAGAIAHLDHHFTKKLFELLFLIVLVEDYRFLPSRIT
jgi:hypothetical protein